MSKEKISISRFLWLHTGEKFTINTVSAEVLPPVRTTSGFMAVFKCYAYWFIFDQEKRFKKISDTKMEAIDVFGNVYSIEVEANDQNGR